MSSGKKRLERAIEKLNVKLGKVEEEREGRGQLHAYRNYADDPIGFIRDVLGGEPWSKQAEIAEYVRDHRLTLVYSCFGSGKDWIAAREALWFAYALQGLVLVTGPTERQVREITFREIQAAFQGADELPGTLYQRGLVLPGAAGPAILPFATNDASRLRGFHDEHILVIITEAQGVDEFVFEGAQACASSKHGKVLAIGNPDDPDGPFARRARSDRWETIQISAYDHPNFQEGGRYIPDAISREYERDILEDYGRNSNKYRSHILGQFPDQAEDALFKRERLSRATEGYEAAVRGAKNSDKTAIIAIDPAGQGRSETAVAVVIDDTVVLLRTRQGPDPTEIRDWALTIGREVGGDVKLPPPPLSPSRVTTLERGRPTPPDYRYRKLRFVVDATGLGLGLVSMLNEQGAKTYAFEGGTSPSHVKRNCRNLRAESYWTSRELVDSGSVHLPPDEDLLHELRSTRYFISEPDERIQLERKQDIVARLGRSPDRADAATMAIWYGDRFHPYDLSSFSPVTR